jgi:hypothetical protein
MTVNNRNRLGIVKRPRFFPLVPAGGTEYDHVRVGLASDLRNLISGPTDRPDAPAKGPEAAHGYLCK